LFLDAIFHLPARAINLIVELLGATIQIGQNVARISTPLGMFGLSNNASLPVPSLSLVLELAKESYFFSAPLVFALGAFLQLGRERMQALIQPKLVTSNHKSVTYVLNLKCTDVLTSPSATIYRSLLGAIRCLLFGEALPSRNIPDTCSDSILVAPAKHRYTPYR
jgi:hypothetical protein